MMMIMMIMVVMTVEHRTGNCRSTKEIFQFEKKMFTAHHLEQVDTTNSIFIL